MDEAATDFGSARADDRLSESAKAVAVGLRRPSLAPDAISAVAGLLDGVALALGLWFAGYISQAETFDPLQAAAISTMVAFSAAALLWALGSYRLEVLRRYAFGSAGMAALGLALAVALGGGLGGYFVIIAFVLPARALGAALAAAALDFGLAERRAVIIGGGERAARVMAAIAASPGADIRICGIFDDRDDARSPAAVRGIPKLGALASLVSFVRTAEIDMLIVTLPLSAERRIGAVLKAIEVLPVDLRLADYSDDSAFRRRGGLIDVGSRPLRHGERALKRALDIAGAIFAILLLAPVFALTALAIRLDTPGPILFRQPRHGYNNRSVNVWKFRSMYAADCDPAALRIVTVGDPRVTRVGRVIRRYSLDELPQLFNVLRGELSLVGPRPHALAAVSSRQEAFEEIVQGYAARHKVRPGITGWAQVHGWRGEIDDPDALRRRVEHDLHYMENWSIWLDLYILALTPFRLLNTKNAY